MEIYATEANLTDMTSTIHGRLENNDKTLCGRKSTFNYLVSSKFAMTLDRWTISKKANADLTESTIITCSRCEKSALKIEAENEKESFLDMLREIAKVVA